MPLTFPGCLHIATPSAMRDSSIASALLLILPLPSVHPLWPCKAGSRWRTVATQPLFSPDGVCLRFQAPHPSTSRTPDSVAVVHEAAE